MLYQEWRTRYRLSLKSKALHYPMEITNLMLFILKLCPRQNDEVRLFHANIELVTMLLKQRMFSGFF